MHRCGFQHMTPKVFREKKRQNDKMKGSGRNGENEKSR